jgi:hypothetical protein
MAAHPPPTPYRVPIVYRAARNPSWIKQGQVKQNAFYRRKDRDFSGLSVGDTPEAAERGLRENFGIIQITVNDIRALRLIDDNPPVRLEVRPDATIDKGNINTSIPFYDDPDPEQVGIAISIAKALADLAVPV